MLRELCSNFVGIKYKKTSPEAIHEHMIVLLLYEIHVIRTVQISNISDNNMLEMKIYSGHFDVFATMVTGQKTSYKVLFCDHCIYVHMSYNYLTTEWTSISG